MKEIVLAGGCFWGVEKYMGALLGVMATEVGYANGNGETASYGQVCNGSGHVEAVRVAYDEDALTLGFLLDQFYEVIDPTSINRQGADVGVQYRTGIYYTDAADGELARDSIARLQARHSTPVAIEVKELREYYPAEEYHQRYLDKNPTGYCHIPSTRFEDARAAVDPKARFTIKTKSKLKRELTKLQYEVTQNAHTEPPFDNEYNSNERSGVYVDVTTGQPLFTSRDKFESGCGWPAFAKPIDDRVVGYERDDSHGMRRVEVRSRLGDAHLGHVFEDGPKELGGLRYCINSSALRFIPKEDMEHEGYGKYLDLV